MTLYRYTIGSQHFTFHIETASLIIISFLIIIYLFFNHFLGSPHFACPHFETPHFGSPHFETPHFVSPHFACPHFGTPLFPCPQSAVRSPQSAVRSPQSAVLHFITAGIGCMLPPTLLPRGRALNKVLYGEVQALTLSYTIFFFFLIEKVPFSYTFDSTEKNTPLTYLQSDVR